MDRQQEYEREFLKLKQAYVRRIRNTVRIIDNILNLEKFNLPTREDILRAQALVHGLAGSGTTFGYPKITDAGRAADHFLENMLRSMVPGQMIDASQGAEYNAVMKVVQDVCRETCRDALKEIPESANANIDTGSTRQEHAHILVIDDDIDVATAIAHGFESQGMTTQITASGEDALHYMARVRPDTVILDMALKGMDGLEALQQIKQNSEFIDIPVLMISTRNAKGDEEKALRAGAFCFIHKPVDIQDILQRTRQAMTGVSAQQTQSI